MKGATQYTRISMQSVGCRCPAGLSSHLAILAILPSLHHVICVWVFAGETRSHQLHSRVLLSPSSHTLYIQIQQADYMFNTSPCDLQPTLTKRSGPTLDTRSSSMSYCTVEPAGTSAYGASTACAPKPSDAGTLAMRFPPIAMPCMACCKPRQMPGTGDPLMRTTTGLNTPSPPSRYFRPPRVESNTWPSPRVPVKSTAEHGPRVQSANNAR